MAAGKSGGSSGELAFLEGTSMSAMAGPPGSGNTGTGGPWPPDIRLFARGRFGGRRGWGVGAAGAMSGREWAARAPARRPWVRAAGAGPGRREGGWVGREPELHA